MSRELQWSHGQSTVEDVIAGSAFTDPDPGLQWSHGQSTVEDVHRRPRCNGPPRCFNGATANRPWKTRCHPQARGIMTSASMEPRPIDRGRRLDRLPHIQPTVDASMEPRPIDRGRQPYNYNRAHGKEASMEPRPIDRGRLDPAELWEDVLEALQSESRGPNRGNRCSGAVGGRAGGASMEPRPIDRGRQQNEQVLILHGFGQRIASGDLKKHPFLRTAKTPRA